jgi:hypothetical protein
VIKPNTPNRQAHLLWQWRDGAATTVGEFGTPESTSGYQLCLYDPSGARRGIGAPAGVLWTAKPGRFTYRDSRLLPDGVFQVLLKAGGDGKAKIQLTGKGANLNLPAPPFASLPLTVQLKRPDGGECWEATFATALHNEPGRFDAKGGS